MKILFVERDKNFAPVKYPRNTKEEKLIFNEAYLETEYVWGLSRYIGKWDSSLDISPAGPSEMVQDLSVEYLLDILNNDYCFDFDYEPEEEDILVIWYNYKYPDLRRMPKRPYVRGYTYLIFRDGKWIFDIWIGSKTESITQGFIKFL
ncbi:hypothetical protein [Flavobacterium sp. C4GT6]|uniref:hypothetical protein n=1 Tax=Flavobacterium sp. C4GT6 TaxID=3103818 RepID=UPI002ED67786